MAHPSDLIVFALFTVSVIGLGLVFSFKRTGRLTIQEMFLGSRTLRMVPLALSAVSSVMSSIGIIAFTAHFYAYGTHMGWTSLGALLCIPITTDVIIPVLYRLKITSIFEYLRARYSRGFSLTSWVVYFVLTQSLGAVTICAAAMAISTIFQIPFLWNCLAIGLTGTFYTALVSNGLETGLPENIKVDSGISLTKCRLPFRAFKKTPVQFSPSVSITS